MNLTKHPLVTVVIPSYNHEIYVEKSIRSVLTQNYPNVELIVIDDGSKDGSLSIISALKQKHDFEVIARGNKGLSATLNEGINLANGKYICFLASDDYYLPNRIESAVPVLENSDANVFATYCDGYIVNDAGKAIARFSDKYPKPLIGGTYNNLLVGNWLPALGMTYKYDALRRYMFDEKFKVEDYTLYLKMFSKNGGNLISLSDFCFAYRWHASNFSMDSQVMNAQQTLIEGHFTDVQSYQNFKRGIKAVKLNTANISVRNFTTLFLELIRKLQWRSKVAHRSLSGLFRYFFLRASRLFIERLRGFYYFGWSGLSKKIRVTGNVKIQGIKCNFSFGQNVRILGDLRILIADSVSGKPSITIGDRVTIEHGTIINSHGGWINVGSGCHLGVMSIIQGRGGVQIGQGSMMGPGVKLFASNHNFGGDLALHNSGENFIGISIGKNVWVGADSVVLDGSTIGDDCVFGAGGVITGSYPNGSKSLSKCIRVKPITDCTESATNC